MNKRIFITFCSTVVLNSFSKAEKDSHKAKKSHEIRFQVSMCRLSISNVINKSVQQSFR